VADETWARAEVDRLEELRLTALETRIDADLSPPWGLTVKIAEVVCAESRYRRNAIIPGA
jgi:hypothetical protein